MDNERMLKILSELIKHVAGGSRENSIKYSKNRSLKNY